MSNLPPNNKSISGVSDVLNLDGVVFIGRTFLEYMRMFNLDTSQLGLKILDCPSGASSFVAEASSEHQVGTAVGCDLLYGNIDRFCHLLHDMPSQKFLTIYFFCYPSGSPCGLQYWALLLKIQWQCHSSCDNQGYGV
jgi:hypothetical protein